MGMATLQDMQSAWLAANVTASHFLLVNMQGFCLALHVVCVYTGMSR